MNSKTRLAASTSYSITISTPFGVLRYSCASSGRFCAECDQVHVVWTLKEASPRLRAGDADDFLAILPEFLSAVGEAAILDCGVLARFEASLN